jgi:signal transduction histidine kinase
MFHSSPAAGRPLRVLLVEDDDAHARLAAEWLELEGHGGFDVVRVDRLSAGLAALSAGPVDAILLDLSLPDSDRIETFRAVRARAPSTPIVLMTGIGDDGLALQAVQEGAQDYLVKGDIDGRLVVRALRYAIERGRADAAERRLLEAQRLDSLSALAGGIAHQLNNLLVIVVGNASLAAADLDVMHPVHRYLEEIEAASQQAARLARQMLAYSGRGGFILRPVDVNDVVRSATAAIAGRLPPAAALHLELAATPAVVLADEAELAQLVVNLVTNAGEALERGAGDIRVATGLVDAAGEDFAQAYMTPDLPPGRYVELVVTDTGAGMSREVSARIFEPFFSTRLAGRGLGLPAALGIVRGHSGAIAVESSPGNGTRVRVLLPASAPVTPRGEA